MDEKETCDELKNEPKGYACANCGKVFLGEGEVHEGPDRARRWHQLQNGFLCGRIVETPGGTHVEDVELTVRITKDESKLKRDQQDVRMTHKERRERWNQMSNFAKTHTVAETAREFGVGPSTVRGACVLHEVRPARGPYQESRVSKFGVLKDLMDGELSNTEVALKHNCTKQHISMIRIQAREVGFDI